ncbi:MAG: hypothetical protein ACD_29C00169G0001 [uncultured bacterium]|nr:MAG: hypothetical protein ACD_29C00169G0001 [uncultured bacterium]
MPIVKLPSQVEMYYEVHGQGEPLVLINGLKSDHNGWAPMLNTLKEHFQLILLDNRGMGQTKDNGKAFLIDDMALDVIHLMDHLKIESAYIAGHSMGGAIAQRIGYIAPEKVKKLFLCNTFIKFNNTARQVFENVLTLYHNNASRVEIIDAVIPWVFVDGFVTPELRKLIHDQVNADPLWQSKEDYARQLHALNTFDSSGWVEKIAVSTVVIGSKADKTALPKESELLAEKMNAGLVMLDGGHASAVEQSVAFSDILLTHAQQRCNCTM